MSQIALTVIGEDLMPLRTRMVFLTESDPTTTDLEVDTIMHLVIDQVFVDSMMVLHGIGKGIDRVIEDTTMVLGTDRVTEDLTMDHLGIDMVTKAMMTVLVTDGVNEDTAMDLLVIDQVIEALTMGHLVIGRVLDPDMVGTEDTMMALEEMIVMEIEETDMAVDGIMTIGTGRVAVGVMGEKDSTIVGIAIGTVAMIAEVLLVEIGMGIVMVATVIVEAHTAETVTTIVHSEIAIATTTTVGVTVMETKIEGVTLMNKTGTPGVMVIAGVMGDGIIMKKCQNQ